MDNAPTPTWFLPPRKKDAEKTVEISTGAGRAKQGARRIKLDGHFGSVRLCLFISGTRLAALRLIPEVGTS
jgi:hypothetical protein